MNKLKITTRLAIVVGMLSLLLIGIGILGLWGQAKTNNTLRNVYEDRMVPTVLLGEVHSELLSARLSIANARGNPNIDEVNKFTGDAREHLAKVEKTWKKVMQTRLTPEELELADQFNTSYQNLLRNGLLPAVDALQANQQEKLIQIIANNVRPYYGPTRSILEKLVNLQSEVASEEYAVSVERFETFRTVCLLSILFGVLAAVGMGAAFMIGLKRSLSVAMQASSAVAQGDLTYDIRIEGQDEMAQLLESMAAAQAGLKSIVHEVRVGAGTIATASSQIASGNMDLSSRTEEQASSLEETAASMEEITKTVKQNAQNARQANELASSASRVAVRGGEVVSRAVSTMDAISNSSRKIVEIIGIIDSIAFQTNILALNAAVEAARAGEQGRGFAVVASEVRTLAQRSASAAKEIKSLIDESVNSIEQGSSQVAEAGQTMDDIVSSVKRVTDIMGEIASASDEQSTGIDHIHQALSQMDQVTQQNAALVEEAAAAAQSLQEQAAALSKTVSIFKMEQNALAA